MQEFNKKFQIDELLIDQIGNWKISLRPEQPTIGSMVLSLARPCPVFSKLTEEESKDLGKAFKVIERLYLITFKPQKVNYLALMMVDEQVHYHVLPRYENSVEFDGNLCVDQWWPKPVDLLVADDCVQNKNVLLEFFRSKLKHK